MKTENSIVLETKKEYVPKRYVRFLVFVVYQVLTIAKSVTHKMKHTLLNMKS